MGSLPSEILHNIFIQVSFEQRLECMLVCRYWYSSLSKRGLLYNLGIESDVKLKKFIDMLQLFPHRGSQVEILNLTVSSKFDKRILNNILPNLRTFEYGENRFPYQFHDHCSQPFKLVNPNSKLESITDEADCELTVNLLRYGSFLHLRNLDLSLDMIKNPRKEVFDYMKNLPALRDLTLRYSQFGIEDAEILHQNIPTLKMLNLNDIILVQGELPRDIIPATSVTIFNMVITCVRNYPNCPEWYKYLAKKYINLTYFNCRNLQLFQAELNEVIKIYRDGILPLYVNNGNRLKYFDAKNIPTELNPFHTLDENGLQISNFNLELNGRRPIFEQLAKSKQSKYATSLKFEYTAIASPVMLQNFTSLRTLKIDMGTGTTAQWNINLTDYLNAIPPTLILFAANVFDVDSKKLPSHPNNIQLFSLICTTLSPELTDIISSFFPKLDSLHLQGRVKENLNLDLTNHHISILNILAYYDEGDSQMFSMVHADSYQPKCRFNDLITINIIHSHVGKCYLRTKPISDNT